MYRTGRLVAVGALLCAAAPLSPAAAAGRPRAATTLAPHSLRVSHDLWATIDVCSTPKQTHTVGIRGSMPGDGHSADTVYMRFRLQYLSDSLGTWIDLPHAATGFMAVGSARTTRQGGRSFVLTPGSHPSTLRGVVTFQWRHGSTVLAAISRATTSGHQSSAGAEPPGFSAATCEIR
jgi:hypothetical protein